MMGMVRVVGVGVEGHHTHEGLREWKEKLVGVWARPHSQESFISLQTRRG